MDAIFLDLGNVLVRFDERTEVLKRITGAFGGDDQAVVAIFGGTGEKVYQHLDNGKVTHRELWRRVCSVGKIDSNLLTYHLFTALYVEHLQPIREMISFVKQLQERYKIVAVSNGDFGNQYVVSMLKAHYGIHFLRVFLSLERRCLKPELLSLAICEMERDCGIRRENCIYVDDIARYAEAAHAIGMKGGLIFNATKEPVATLKAALVSAGVKI